MQREYEKIALSLKSFKIELYLQWLTNRKLYSVYGLSDGAIFNDLEQPVTQLFSRSRHNSMLNVSEMVRDTDTVTIDYGTLIILICEGRRFD